MFLASLSSGKASSIWEGTIITQWKWGGIKYSLRNEGDQTHNRTIAVMWDNRPQITLSEHYGLPLHEGSKVLRTEESLNLKTKYEHVVLKSSLCPPTCFLIFYILSYIKIQFTCSASWADLWRNLELVFSAHLHKPAICVSVPTHASLKP